MQASKPDSHWPLQVKIELLQIIRELQGAKNIIS